MHIFTLMMTAAPGHSREAGQLTPQLRDLAASSTGVATSAWAVVLGAPSGTYAVSAEIDGTDHLLEAFAKVNANESWIELIEKSGHLFAGPAETSYAQVVATTRDVPGEPPLVSITRARIAAGHLQAGLTGAAKVLEVVNEVTGLNGILTVSSAGQMNEVNWMFGVESGAEGDAAVATLAANPAYLELVDSIGEHFVEGSSDRLLVARM